MSVLRLTTTHKAARNAGTLAWLDAGPQPACLELFDGLPPSAPESVHPANLLGRIELQKPAGVLVGAALSLRASGDGMALLTGLVGWARIVNGAGEVAGDGLCTDADGAGPFRLSALQLYQGGTVRLVSAVLG